MSKLQGMSELNTASQIVLDHAAFKNRLLNTTRCAHTSLETKIDLKLIIAKHPKCDTS